MVSDNSVLGNTSGFMGGGIYCEGGSPTLTRNTISSNSAYYDGGGLFLDYSEATVSGNIIFENTAFTGAGVCAPTGFPLLTLNHIVNNVAEVSGGGVSMGGGILAANMIVSNSAWSGGGIDCLATMSIAGNTVADNDAAQGGGIHIAKSNNPFVYSNIVAFNNGGIFKPEGPGSPTLCGNCVYGNGEDYTNIGIPATDVRLDPRFVNRPAGDYHISAGSPCIDAACATRPPLTTEDIDGDPRVIGGADDIGADEFTDGSTTVSIAEAKQAAPGSRLTIEGAAVTAVFDGFFYVESTDRSCGMRVEKQAHGLTLPTGANATGTTGIAANGEYCIFAESVSEADAEVLKPLGLSQQCLGGGRLGGQPAIWEWSYSLDRRAPMGGLSNIGMLVRIWGAITDRRAGEIRIDDGSGVGVKCVLPAGMIVQPGWQYVTATGISSCEKQGDQLERVLLVRKQADIAPL